MYTLTDSSADSTDAYRRKVSNTYFVMQMDDQNETLVVVEVHGDWRTTPELLRQIEGDLRPVSTKVRSLLPGYVLHPYMIVASDTRGAASAFIVLLGICAGIGLFFTLLGWKRWSNPTTHRYYQDLNIFGDPATLAQEISAEMAVPPRKL